MRRHIVSCDNLAHFSDLAIETDNAFFAPEGSSGLAQAEAPPKATLGRLTLRVRIIDMSTRRRPVCTLSRTCAKLAVLSVGMATRRLPVAILRGHFQPPGMLAKTVVSSSRATANLSL